jgi:DNA-binding transcriptional LysR family regulator
LQAGTALTQYGPMQWDDLRFVLAVARTGSALRAGSRLGVNQTTVLRRLDAIEGAVGAPLFERTRSGQTLTAIGRIVMASAERMEREAYALGDAISAQRRTLSGSVRLTTSEGMVGYLVTPFMRAFRSRYPGISIELIISDERLDLARGEADVALRASSKPEGAGILARRMPDLDWTVFCSRAYAAEHGIPGDRDAIRSHEIVGWDGRMAQLTQWRWLSASAPDAVIRFRSNSFVTQVSNLKAGLGIGALPTIIGDAEPELLRCFPPPPEMRAELWLIVREAVRAHPQVRALTDFLACRLRETIGGAAKI